MKSTAPKISIRGGGTNDSTNTATSSWRASPCGPYRRTPVAPDGQLAGGVAGHRPDRGRDRRASRPPSRRPRRAAGRPTAGPATTVARATGSSRSTAVCQLVEAAASSGFDEQVDRAAAGEPDGERLVVAVAEGVHSRARRSRGRRARPRPPRPRRSRRRPIRPPRRRRRPPSPRRGRAAPSRRCRPRVQSRPACPAAASAPDRRAGHARAMTSTRSRRRVRPSDPRRTRRGAAAPPPSRAPLARSRATPSTG